MLSPKRTRNRRLVLLTLLLIAILVIVTLLLEMNGLTRQGDDLRTQFSSTIYASTQSVMTLTASR